MKDDARLHELAGKIGARAGERLDVEATVQAVVARLRQQPQWPAVATPRWARPAWLRIAAALVVLVGGGIVARGILTQPAVADHYVAEDLTDLSADQLQQLLATLEETLTAPGTGAESGLEGLTEQQLREVLRSLEG